MLICCGCDITVHARRGIFPCQAEAAADDAYLSLRSGAGAHRASGCGATSAGCAINNAASASEIESVAVQQFVLRGEAEDHWRRRSRKPDRLDPVVIAEMQMPLHTLTVGEAVMRLDLRGTRQ